MKHRAFLYLMLTTGTIATAQQSTEWRPNIAEDNKAATWEDTKAFIVGMLDASGFASQAAKADDRCLLVLPASVDAPLGIRAVGNSSGLVIVGVQSLSFSDRHGLEAGMHLSAVNRRPMKTVADFGAFVATLKPGDAVVFEVDASGDRNGTEYLGGTLSNDDLYPDSKGKSLDWALVRFQLVDPLTVVVRNTTVYMSGTNGQAIAYHMDNGPEGKPTIREDSFTLKDIESAKRTARALMHAALLCGGTKAVSPF